MSTFSLRPLDYAIVAAYFALIVGMGLYFGRKAKRSMLDYFLSHRSMPWWLAGTAMVATTFSADTPLAVTEMVVKNGVAGNWLWWSMLGSGMLTVFFFARLWRRAGSRHRCRADRAALLRPPGRVPPRLPRRLPRPHRQHHRHGLGQPRHGQGALRARSASRIAARSFACLLITFAYTVYSGYWGVATTHGVQYIFEMGGAIILAVVALGAVGGVDVLKAKLAFMHPAGTPPGTTFGTSAAAMAFWPTGDGVWVVPTITLAALLGLNWWASWYPGSEPGGGGYVVQNMLACRNEREARSAALFFNIAHYAMRSWPWVITALCTLVMYGGAVVRQIPGSTTCGRWSTCCRPDCAA